MDLRRLLAIGRSHLPLLIVGLLLGGGIATAYSTSQPKIYEAKTTLIVGQALSGVPTDINQLLVSQRLSATYAAVATTRPVLEGVIQQLKLTVSPDQLLKSVRATAQLDSTLVSVWAQNEDPQRAADLANAVARQLIAASPTVQGRDQQLQAAVDAELDATLQLIESTQEQVERLAAQPSLTPAQDAQLQSLENRLVTLRSTYATVLAIWSNGGSNMLSVIEPAVATTDPISPRIPLNALLGALLGLFAAIGIAALRTYLHDVIRDADEVEDVVGLGTLATIARYKPPSRSEPSGLVTLVRPRSSAAEAYRTLRANIEFATADATIKTLLVTSAGAREGKTVTAANLAAAFAQAGREVLLVDADLRKPTLQLLFRLPNERGLTTLIGEHIEIDSVVQATEQKHLHVLTTGPLASNSAELLGSPRMRSLLERLTSNGQLVVMDSPPLLALPDATILSSFLDGTVLMIDAEQSRRRSVRLAGMALVRANARVLGVALNGVRDVVNAGYDLYYDEAPVVNDLPVRAATPPPVRGRARRGIVRRSDQ